MNLRIDKSFEGLQRERSREIEELQRRLGRQPGRLSASGQEVVDWDQATLPGFYWSEPSTPNAPNASAFVGQVFVAGGAFDGRIVQEAVIPGLTSGTFRMTYRRVRSELGVWSAWSQTGPLHAEFSGSLSLSNSGLTAIPVPVLDSAYSTDSTIASPVAGGVSVAAGLYLVGLEARMTVSPVSAVTRYFGETFDSVSGASRLERLWAGVGEDLGQGLTTRYLPSAGTITAQLYQTSGATRTTTFRLKITKL